VATIKQFEVCIEAESEKKLHVLRMDCDSEFTSMKFATYCTEPEVVRNLIVPCSPQQNGMLECRNQTSIGMARSMLKGEKMSSEFWGEAVNTTAFILNCVSTKALKGMTPFEAWYGRKPDVSFLRTFGCISHVKRMKSFIGKLENRSMPMVLLDYEEGSKENMLFDPRAGKVVVLRNVVFDKMEAWDWEDPGTGEDVSSSSSSTFTIEHMAIPGGGNIDAEEDAAQDAPSAGAAEDTPTSSNGAA
jgi:hypothetical protein